MEKWLRKIAFDIFCIICILEETSIMKWLIERLKEPSTWAGLAVIAQVGGQVSTSDISPELIGAAVTALAAIGMGENKSKK